MNFEWFLHKFDPYVQFIPETEKCNKNTLTCQKSWDNCL